jgi:peroxiredoxin
MVFLAVAAALAAMPAWGFQQGEAAPDFILSSAAGESVTLREFQGKVVVIAFWASWGKHVDTQLKHLEQLENELGGKGLVVIGVNEKEPAQMVKGFAERNRLTMLMLLDDGSVARTYGMDGVPDIWILNRRGEMCARFVGYAPGDPQQIRREVEAALGETLAPAPETPPEVPAASPLPPALRAYAHLQIGAAHINIGDAFVKAGYRDYGHFETALGEFRAGLALAPNNVDLHVWLGLACERRGDITIAANEYRSALKLDPSNRYAQDALRRLGIPWVAGQSSGKTGGPARSNADADGARSAE